MSMYDHFMIEGVGDFDDATETKLNKMLIAQDLQLEEYLEMSDKERDFQWWEYNRGNV